MQARPMEAQQNQWEEKDWWAGQDSNLQPDRYERLN
jgi:hypothetical protein